MSPESLGDIRWEYQGPALRRTDLAEDPVTLFNAWFEKAKEAEGVRSNVMTLASLAEGAPDARVVLLKDVRAEGLVFFTDGSSAKAQQLTADPRASAVFHWPALHQQVRIWGEVSKVERQVAEEYFASRPRESQLAAWTSSQSTPIENRAALEGAYQAIAKQFLGKEIPAPEDWTGFALQPQAWEFWQGRPGRLHDRFRYQPKENGNGWEIHRLQP